MNPNFFWVIGPGFLHQVPTLPSSHPFFEASKRQLESKVGFSLTPRCLLYRGPRGSSTLYIYIDIDIDIYIYIYIYIVGTWGEGRVFFA